MKFFRREIAAYICVLGTCIALTGCSGQHEQLTEVEQHTRETESKIVGFTEGSLNWDQLDSSQQTLYRNIYKRQLPQSEQAAWDKELKAKGVAQSDGKPQLRAPVEVVESQTKVVPAADAPKSQAELYAESAQHIRLVWNKKMPIAKLRPDEIAWYRAIYNKTLPPKQLKGWYAFLTAPTPKPSVSSGQMIELSLPH